MVPGKAKHSLAGHHQSSRVAAATSESPPHTEAYKVPRRRASRPVRCGPVRTWAWPTPPDVRIHASRKGAEKSGAQRHATPKRARDGASARRTGTSTTPPPEAPARSPSGGARSPRPNAETRSRPRTPGAWSCCCCCLAERTLPSRSNPRTVRSTPIEPVTSPPRQTGPDPVVSSWSPERDPQPPAPIYSPSGSPWPSSRVGVVLYERWAAWWCCAVPGMSCNGCRVLRKGCSDACVLRPCLQWIDGAEAQGHATVFVAKFFGRAGLMSFLTAVPEPQRPAVFQSLLYEAAGRTINPVSGAVGLLGAGSWHLCQAAVETVLRGGAIGPLPEFDGARGASFSLAARRAVGCSTFSTAKRALPTRATTNVGAPPPVPPPEPSCDLGLWLSPGSPPLAPGERLRPGTPSMTSEESVTTTTSGGGGGGGREPELLNLFV